MMRLRKYIIIQSFLVLLAASLPVTTVWADDQTTIDTTVVVTTSEEPKVVTTEATITTQEPVTTQEPITTQEPVTTTVEKPRVPTPSDYPSCDNPSLKAIDPAKAMPLPQELVGTWNGVSKYNKGLNVTLVIYEDGSGTARWWDQDDSFPTYVFQINQVEHLGNQVYRFIGGLDLSAIVVYGIGGWNVKYDFGYILQDGQLQTIMWGARCDEEIDYTAGFYGAVYEKVTEAPKASTVPPLTNKVQQQTLTPTLPKTGESMSIWLPIIGVGLLGGLAYFFIKNRKK